jgi:glutaredoxin
VKEFLSHAGKKFDVLLVDEDDLAYDELLKLGYRTVPVTVIGEHVVLGFDQEGLAKALSGGG